MIVRMFILMFRFDTIEILKYIHHCHLLTSINLTSQTSMKRQDIRACKHRFERLLTNSISHYIDNQPLGHEFIVVPHPVNSSAKLERDYDFRLI